MEIIEVNIFDGISPWAWASSLVKYDSISCAFALSHAFCMRCFQRPERITITKSNTNGFELLFPINRRKRCDYKSVNKHKLKICRYKLPNGITSSGFSWFWVEEKINFTYRLRFQQHSPWMPLSGPIVSFRLHAIIAHACDDNESKLVHFDSDGESYWLRNNYLLFYSCSFMHCIWSGRRWNSFLLSSYYLTETNYSEWEKLPSQWEISSSRGVTAEILSWKQ